MSNYQANFGMINQPPFQSIQQMFPQPQGSVYSISSPIEIGNVPIGSTGLSVALCLPEQILYIKSFQNGNPVVMAYRISPFQKQQDQKEVLEMKSDDVSDRLTKLEQMVQQLTTNHSGGKFNELL